MDQRQLTKRTANALERLERMEQSQGQVVGAVSQVQAQLQAVVEVLDTLVELAGAEKVQEKLSVIRKEKAIKKSEADKKQLDEMLLQELLVAVPKITQTTIVVGLEKNKAGDIMPPGRVQIPWQGINPQFKDKFLDLEVGAKVDFPDGGSFEVQEIYGMNPNPPKAEPTEPPQAEVPVAPAPAAEAAPATAPEVK